MTSHTPGPWKAHPGKLPDSGRDMFRVRADDGGTEAVVAVCFPSSCGDIYEEDAEANARLIAAAPDLLSALRALVGAIEEDDFAGALESALAAIAKATA